MNEILQKRIEEAAHQYIQSDAVKPENMQLAFGDFINGAKWALQNQWISVEEALPQDNKVVFYKALSEKGTKCYGSAYVFNKEWYSDISSAAQYYYHFKITHWMNIPS